MSLHEPYAYECGDTDTIIIFIHGFIGSPHSFRYLAEAVREAGYAYSAILLPGHGKNALHFAASNLVKWESHLQAEIEKYRTRYKNIILVGHSMGGLLGLNAVLDPANPICAAILIASPLFVKPAPRAVLNSLRAHLIRLGGENDRIRSYRDNCSVRNWSIISYPLWIRPLASLRRLMRSVKRNMKDCKLPVLLIYSRRDELVRMRSAGRFVSGLQGETRLVELTESWHMYYTPAERQIIEREIVSFVRGTEKHEC